MMLAPIVQPIIGGENNLPTNRLPYNSRQRMPSMDSDTSSTVDTLDGPSADEYKFIESSHSMQVMT